MGQMTQPTVSTHWSKSKSDKANAFLSQVSSFTYKLQLLFNCLERTT